MDRLIPTGSPLWTAPARWGHLIAFGLSVLLFGGGLVTGLAYRLHTSGALPGIGLDYLAEGDRYALAGDASAAARVYRRAAALAPDDDQALFRLGMAARRLGDSRQSVDAFERVLRLNPRHAPAHFMLGAAYLEQGDLERAARHAAAARRLRPDLADSHALLGAVEARRGNRDAAIQHLRQALRIDPYHERARSEIAALGQEAERR
ncbi:MAG: tetratricopeptide repeat protein [Candidatus Rokubacteria bacterium]|nr:tetratricopeptide repeat protein [Candidatus Rokubacteria bacterium]